MHSIDRKVIVKFGNPVTVQCMENAGGNDTVPISVWRCDDMSSAECRWLFIEFFFVLRWSVHLRVRAF